VIAKPKVFVTPIPPLTSDLPLELPFISQSISLLRSRLAVAGLACGCDCQRGLDRLSRRPKARFAPPGCGAL